MYIRAQGSPIKAPAVGFHDTTPPLIGAELRRRYSYYTGVMQTASGLPKKSLEERKVSSEGGRSKASGGKKEGLEAVVERLDSEWKVARKGVQARFQARFQARTRREIHEDHVF